VFAKSKSRSGINPAVPRDKKRPKVMDLQGGNGDVIIDGRKAGRHHGFDVMTFEGSRKHKGGAEAMSFSTVELGSDNMLFSVCRSSDDKRSNPCALMGGSGRFAGARGTITDTKLTETKTGFRVDLSRHACTSSRRPDTGRAARRVPVTATGSRAGRSARAACRRT
jgi:hypothetical protein